MSQRTPKPNAIPGGLTNLSQATVGQVFAYLPSVRLRALKLRPTAVPDPVVEDLQFIDQLLGLCR